MQYKCKELQKQIEAATLKNAEVTNRENRQQFEEQERQKEIELSGLQQKIKVAKQHKFTLEQAQETAETRARQASDELKRAQREERDAKGQLATLQSSQGGGDKRSGQTLGGRLRTRWLPFGALCLALGAPGVTSSGF